MITHPASDSTSETNLFRRNAEFKITRTWWRPWEAEPYTILRDEQAYAKTYQARENLSKTQQRRPWPNFLKLCLLNISQQFIRDHTMSLGTNINVKFINWDAFSSSLLEQKKPKQTNKQNLKTLATSHNNNVLDSSEVLLQIPAQWEVYALASHWRPSRTTHQCFWHLPSDTSSRARPYVPRGTFVLQLRKCYQNPSKGKWELAWRTCVDWLVPLKRFIFLQLWNKSQG